MNFHYALATESTNCFKAFVKGGTFIKATLSFISLINHIFTYWPIYSFCTIKNINLQVFSETMRPKIILNAAMSADGKISTIKRKQVRISGEYDFARMDRMRADADAVMVGIGTVLADDPSLTVKSERLRYEHKQRWGRKDPIRIVVDSMARTPIDADIFNKGDGDIIIAVCNNAPGERVKKLNEKSRIITIGRDRVDLVGLMSNLKDSGINTLMVEGGATLNWALISGKLVDEIHTYIGAIILGGENAPTLVDGTGFFGKEDAVKLELASMEKMDNGVLLRWHVLNQDKK